MCLLDFNEVHPQLSRNEHNCWVTIRSLCQNKLATAAHTMQQLLYLTMSYRLAHAAVSREYGAGLAEPCGSALRAGKVDEQLSTRIGASILMDMA